MLPTTKALRDLEVVIQWVDSGGMRDMVFLRGGLLTLSAASPWALRSQDLRLEVPCRHPSTSQGMCLLYYPRLGTPAFPNTPLATASEEEIISAGSQVM